MAIEILCHFDGSNGSIDIVDETGTIPYFDVTGAAALSTTGQTFGTACLWLNSGRVTFVDGNGQGADFAVADFTIRYRYTPDSNDVTGTHYVLMVGGIETRIESGVLKTTVYFTDATSTELILGTVSASTPYALSIERYGDVFSAYLNGNRVAQFTRTKIVDKYAGSISASAGFAIYGKIDELLVDNGVSYAQNATSYTVETVQFSLAVGLQRFDIVASIASVYQSDITAIIANIQTFEINAATGNVKPFEISAVISRIENIAIAGLIGVINTTQIDFSAVIAMTTKTHVSVNAPINLLSQNITTIQIVAVIRLLDDADSVVIDMQKPEIPIYGSYA